MCLQHKQKFFPASLGRWAAYFGWGSGRWQLLEIVEMP